MSTSGKESFKRTEQRNSRDLQAKSKDPKEPAECLQYPGRGVI